MNKLIIIVACCILVACANHTQYTVLSVEDDMSGKDISNIRPVGFRLTSMPDPKVDTSKAIAKYERFLELAPEGEARVHVMHRLADLKLMDVEEILAETPENLENEQVLKVYEETIDTYEKVLQRFPNRHDSDMLLYQLSKVYMLVGKDKEALSYLTRLVDEFPKSELISEVQYRRGDILFNLGEFMLSHQAFKFSAKNKESNRFFLSANYMAGWSAYKKQDYRAAITSFVNVIDNRFEDTTAIVTASKGDKELLDDTVRVLSMMFSDEGGYQQISKLMKQLGSRHYEYLLYDGLAEFYLAKKQYSDAAKTYEAYVLDNPTDVLAPTFYKNIINSYKQAGYVDLVLQYKANYVEKYGVKGTFWKLFGEDIKEIIRPEIKTYSTQLAQYHHSKGQNSKSIKTKFNHLLSANRWYQSYIDMFPSDNEVGGVYFLKGEALYELGKFEEAIYAYTQGGYDSPIHEKSSQSAFSALVAFNQVIESANPKEKAHWIERKVESAMRFSYVFPGNSNTPQVLARAAEGLFNIGRFNDAAKVSASVLIRKDTTPKQRSVAYLIKGHSHFDLKEYNLAERAYLAALKGNYIQAKQADSVNEKLAASIYRQAVANVENNEFEEAIKNFMRVGKVVPLSPIRITAHYDAATYLMKNNKWKKAEELLISFKEKYNNNELSKDIPSKLIIAYENLEEWSKAAYELQNIWRFSRDKEKQRIALYQSAEYYERGDDIDNTMVMLRRYAHNYPIPFDAQLEAIDKLEGLYLKKDQHIKRRFWLKKLITSHQSAGKDQTERSKYLAAKASFELADYERKAYASIALSLPLKKSLGVKKAALKKTLDAYQRTAKMEVQEFTTASTFQIAEIYGELSRDLMSSQRPAGMDEVELEEYEFLLEDQAFPFEEAAINIHETNIKRSWDGLYDSWIENSISALSKLLPARYAKQEKSYDAIAEIH